MYDKPSESLCFEGRIQPVDLAKRSAVSKSLKSSVAGSARGLHLVYKEVES